MTSVGRAPTLHHQPVGVHDLHLYLKLSCLSASCLLLISPNKVISSRKAAPGALAPSG